MTDDADRPDSRDVLRRWREIRTGAAPAPASPAGRRVLLAASFTANPLEPSLGVSLHHIDTGSLPHIEFAEYNQLFQVCLQPEQSGATDTDDIVVIWRIEDVFERDFHAWANGDEPALQRLLDGARALGGAVAGLAASVSARVVVSDAPTPIGFGLDHRDPAWLAELVAMQHAVNEAFDNELAGVVLDRFHLAALQHAHGTLATFDRRNWVMYRQPFTDWFAHVVGRSIGDVIAARTRVPPKVLVLDCDNTLWEGTLADDGVGGLVCSDAFPGFAYRSFQFAAQRLRHRGVLLALASKNDDDAVTQAFEQVDGMVLGDDDIAARRVSWGPKPDGIASLADELHLGLDSFVFVDDSDYELGAVTTQLPDVRVLRVPDDIEALPDLLAESGLFRLARVTDDDRERTARIRAEAGRARAATAIDHAEFLATLGLRVTTTDVGTGEIGRVTQLVNKTNQFNLTTIRRSESEIAALVADPDWQAFAFAVDDRFGEYGIVGVTIAHRVNQRAIDDASWELDTVLMSCRVLGRGVETAMLAATVDALRSIGSGAITARFRASERNRMVADLLPDHGFELVGGTPGDAVYVLPADRAIAVPDHVTVVAP